MNNDLSQIFTEGIVSDFNFQNPFNNNNITYVSIAIHKANLFTKGNYPEDSWVFEASITFKKEDTRGEQKFIAGSYKELMQKMQAFCSKLD